jgi:hypothetical protein
LRTLAADATRARLRDGFDRPFPVGDTRSSLERIAAVRLRDGRTSTCVATVRANLRRAGMPGLPEATGNDNNNPRGMMVQMLNSGHWETATLPGSSPLTIRSPYGTAVAQVLSREDFLSALDAGLVPNGALVFQTKHGWDYSGGSLGNDVGIMQDGRLHNYRFMSRPDVYGELSRDFVVMLPR